MIICGFCFPRSERRIVRIATRRSHGNPPNKSFQMFSDLPEGERVMILAPIVRGRKGEFKKELEKLHKDGFIRARIDGEMHLLDEEIKLSKQKNHTIEVVVDRLLLKEGVEERLTESVKTALKLTDGAVLISIIDGDEKLYSEKMACVNCGINIPPLEPRSFSFNSNFGACKKCARFGSCCRNRSGTNCSG